MTAGQRRASAEEWRQPAGPQRQGAHKSIPATTIGVLVKAQGIAAQKWHPTLNDIYAVVREAWLMTGTDTPVAWTGLMRALRREVPGGDLLAWNDAEERSRSDLEGLLRLAARGLIARAV